MLSILAIYVCDFLSLATRVGIYALNFVYHDIHTMRCNMISIYWQHEPNTWAQYIREFNITVHITIPEEEHIGITTLVGYHSIHGVSIVNPTVESFWMASLGQGEFMWCNGILQHASWGKVCASWLCLVLCTLPAMLNIPLIIQQSPTLSSNLLIVQYLGFKVQ